jgi:hypothetical protein
VSASTVHPISSLPNVYVAKSYAKTENVMIAFLRTGNYLENIRVKKIKNVINDQSLCVSVCLCVYVRAPCVKSVCVSVCVYAYVSVHVSQCSCVMCIFCGRIQKYYKTGLGHQI